MDGAPLSTRAAVASHDVYSVDRIERLPLHVVIDGSFAAVVLRKDALAERTRPIVDRAVADGSVLYFNRLMEVELAAEQDRSSVDLCAEWDRFRRAAAVECIELDDVADDAVALVRRHRLTASEAVHVQTVLEVGASALLTAHLGMARVPGPLLRIVTVPGSVRRMRRRRARTATR